MTSATLEKKRFTKEDAKRLEEKASDCIFTVSASDFARVKGVDLKDYSLKGVEAVAYTEGGEACDRAPSPSAMGGLARLCEELGAEAVVDVRPTVLPTTDEGRYSQRDRVYLIGTALIPKQAE